MLTRVSADRTDTSERARYHVAVTGPDASVAGVLLAAGSSERYGDRNKLLAELDGEPLVRHAARALDGAGLDTAAAVVAADADGVRDALADFDLELVANSEAAEGRASSIRRGVRWARGSDAVCFALGDMPRVAPEAIDRLVAAYRDGSGSALAAGYEGQRGNPVLFDSRYFDALAALEGEEGGRSVFRDADDSAVVETGDPGALVDVDTPADLAALEEEE